MTNATTRLEQGFATGEMGFGAQVAQQQSRPARCPLWVIRDRAEPAASPAMSAMPPKAEEIQSISGNATGHCGLMALPET